MKKKYYLPRDGEDYDRWYGGESVVCIDKKELERMISDIAKNERDAEGKRPSKASLRRRWREATEKEIATYSVYNG